MSEDTSTVNNNSSILYPQLLNPLKYAKVLMQLGYEPLEPYYGHNLLSVFNIGERKLRYPWIGSYVCSMYNRRGLLHIMTAGCAARLLHDIIGLAFEKTAHLHVYESMEAADRDIDDVVEDCGWQDFRNILIKLSLSKFVEIICTHPFKVIMTRQMAEFLVKDSDNEWFHKATICIYHENGLMGFYKGFVPNAIAEIAKCTLCYFFCRIIRKALNPRSTRALSTGSTIAEPRKDHTRQLIFRSVLRYFCSNMLYPFEVVSTVMMMDNVTLKNGIKLSEFHSWRLCWRTLKVQNQLYRGYSFMFRNHVQPIKQ